MARLHLDDVVRAAGELALRRRPYGLPGHRQRLPAQPRRRVTDEVRRRARRRQRDFFGELVSPRPDEPYLSTLRRAWQVMTGPLGRPYLSMFGKLREDAEQQLWPGFRRESTTDWLQPFEDGMRSMGHPELGTLVLAVVRGLIMDIETTGHTSRADRAFDDFLTVLASSITQGSASTEASPGPT